LLPPSVVHIAGRDVSDSFVIAAMIVKLDEFRDRPPQILRAGVHQQIYARLQRLVEAFQLSVRLRMVRRAASVPDGQHPQIVLEGVRQVARRIKARAVSPNRVAGLDDSVFVETALVGSCSSSYMFTLSGPCVAPD
jgi:hypothetical protein